LEAASPAQDVKLALICGIQILHEEIVLDQDQFVDVLKDIQLMDIHAFNAQVIRFQPIIDNSV
jgi:hypothetical protein